MLTPVIRGSLTTCNTRDLPFPPPTLSTRHGRAPCGRRSSHAPDSKLRLRRTFSYNRSQTRCAAVLTQSEGAGLCTAHLLPTCSIQPLPTHPSPQLRPDEMRNDSIATTTDDPQLVQHPALESPACVQHANTCASAGLWAGEAIAGHICDQSARPASHGAGADAEACWRRWTMINDHQGRAWAIVALARRRECDWMGLVTGCASGW